jgi:hypothetical protein
MPRQQGTVVERDFARGLVTELHELKQDENVAAEIWDCVIDSKTRVVRRLGLEYEYAYETKKIDRDDKVVIGYNWKNALGDGSIDIHVLQVGGELHFFEADSPYSSSAHQIATIITLSTYSPASAPAPDAVPCQFAAGNGKLFVTHPYLETIYLTYASGGTVTATQVDPQIRDLEGMVSTHSGSPIEIDERPTSTVAGLDASHKYNLFNQGWHHNSNAALTTWDGAATTMPSNSDIWWAYKNSSGVFAYSEVANVDLGNTKAPRGHYLLNIYNEDRQTASGISTIAAVTTSYQRASTSAFFAGRLWLSGINYSGRNNRVYFSQVVVMDEDYEKFYQQNDPTVEDISDLVDSDGGWVSIPDAGTIYKLVPLQQALLVFAQNGVWAIAGSEGVGFSATDYSVSQVSSVSTVSGNTFVFAENIPFFWNDDGIYTLNERLQVVSISDDTIKTFLDDIPVASRRLVRGAYNPGLRTIHWLYQSTTPATVNEQSEYDRVLTYNLRTRAFIPWTISTGATYPVAHAIISDDAPVTQTQQNTVVADDAESSTVTITIASPGVITWTSHPLSDTDQVIFTTTGALPTGITAGTSYYVVNSAANTFEIEATIGGGSINTSGTQSGTHTATVDDAIVIEQDSGDTVVTSVISGESGSVGFKYVVSLTDGAGSYDFSFAEARETRYVDWYSIDNTGVSYSSYWITGYKIRGDGIRRQTAPYAVVFMEQEENASLLVQGIWDWSSSSATGKHTTQQQAYSDNRQGFGLNTKRLKFRGSGRALQLRFDSVAGKPFTVVGWGTQESVAGSI